MVVDTILTITDPINAALLGILWWRLEQHSDRVRRVESKIMQIGTKS